MLADVQYVLHLESCAEHRDRSAKSRESDQCWRLIPLDLLVQVGSVFTTSDADLGADLDPDHRLLLRLVHYFDVFH